MLHQRKTAILLALCPVLAACDAGSARELVAPEVTMVDAPSVNLFASSNTWTSKRPMPAARIALQAGTINGIIYAVGGQIPPDWLAVATVQAYSVAANAWAPRRSLPSPRYDQNGASPISGRLYVTGGRNRADISTKTLHVYNPVTNTWVRRADMPLAGCCGAQGVIGGLLYVYTLTGSCGKSLFRYSPATNSWVTLASAPKSQIWPSAGVLGGKFYLAGGDGATADCRAGEPLADLSVYDPATNTWSSKAPMPEAKYYMASGVIKGKFYTAGGFQHQSSATLAAYAPATDNWTSLAPMPTERFRAGSAVAGGLLYVIGGFEVSGFDPTPRVDAYTP